MSISAPVGQQKSSSTSRIPLNTEQAAALCQWLRNHYQNALKAPESIDACKDACKLAFNAGIGSVIQDIQAIAEKDNKPR